ncbi:carbohydrate-binding module family 1 protein [Rhizoctonia solani AG-3 Rhs1AP]|uniref:Carbohydrate-binding module family 1 protein n=1 Tax=Rhizoctonia solani AG-3 Rhs1AP TaxID=1086054 RepID=X8JEE8_9AGAM|nr:carbohydrate-binding module family 1 protein [Rhizoctonia solani AG-3 Rhs1AP]
MSRVALFSIAALTALVSGVNAQQPVYAQCGGASWTGATTCATGSTCVRQSEWYSQCLPGVATTTTKPVTSSTAAPVTSKTTSSSTPTSSTTPAGVKYWFSFGDSYTQTGFDINGTKPTVGNPLGNPTYPGYTACGSVLLG